MAESLNVAVIGAGLAGLVTARELQREGHRVVVFEKEDRIGGTWVYDSRVEKDPLSLDPDREVVHSSLYLSLRTNLPRHIMGFLDYPFTVRDYGDSRAFPGHEEVHSFLKEFAKDFGLTELTRFNTEVIRVELVNDEWVVESRTRESRSEEVFEAVVVCNGHFTEPHVAELPGIEKWPGEQIHSHNYRIPEPFRDQIVVIIGNGPSAYDISRDISKVAKEVHLSSRSPDVKVSKFDNHNNMWQHSMVDFVYEDGTVAFRDGSLVHAADIILYCTGYKFNFPFLKTNGIVSIEDNRVGPLYKHVFPLQLAPGLSFVGIPRQVNVFLIIELQAKWISRILSGKVLLPSEEEMLATVEEYYRHMEESGKPKHRTHSLHPNESDEYMDWLVAQTGLPPLDKQIKGILRETLKWMASDYDRFRDKWDVDNWIRAEYTK